MATKTARVYLHGRYPAGTKVKLYLVDGPHVMRHEQGEEVAHGVVDADQRIEFTSGVERNASYLLFGYVDGQPVTVRARGKVDGDNEGTLAQPPVQGDPQTFRTDGQLTSRPYAVDPEHVADLEPELDGDGHEVTKKDLLTRAAELDIKGRSSMSKGALAASIAEAEAKQAPQGPENPDGEGASS